jgi:uncharacterized membrane protein
MPMANPHSTARIAGHPIHPMLIPFPIAFFVAVLACDLAFWQTANVFWASVAMLLLSAGIIMAALAAIAGLTDLIGEPRIRALSAVWRHAGGNVLIVLIELCNWFLRYSQGPDGVVPYGLITLIGCRRHAHFYRLGRLGDGLPGRVGVSEEAERRRQGSGAAPPAPRALMHSATRPPQSESNHRHRKSKNFA